MTKDTFELLSKYNSHVNHQMNQIIAQLQPSEWEKELGGYYKNVKSVCAHLYIADFNWLKRFGLLKPFRYLDQPLFDNQYSMESMPFESIDEFIHKRSELDSVLNSFIEEIQPEDLGRSIQYNNYKNEPQVRNVGGLILHVFNHQTHHRGMISLYLELLGKKNDYSTLAVLV